MSVAEQPKPAGLLARVQGILFRPSAEWDVIAAEPASVRSLFVGYACILAAIPALASLVGGLVFGYGAFFGFRYHPSLATSLAQAVATYGLALLSAFLLGLIIDALAPSFGGSRDRVQAMKVAVYASTAGWVAGIMLLVPVLAIVVGLCALYNVYLLYQGQPKLMKPAADKAFAYTVVTIVVAIVLFLLVGAVVREVDAMSVWNRLAGGAH